MRAREKGARENETEGLRLTSGVKAARRFVRSP